MLRVDIEKTFQGGVRIEAAFDLDLAPAGVAVLFGPSGAGKTTLLRSIAGLERPSRGHVFYGDECWCDVAANRWLRPQQRGAGYLFQDYALFPHLSVSGNLAYGVRGLDRSARQARVAEVAGRLGIDALLDRYPRELSGGQQQRVALARVLAQRPRLLLLDEPFAALDGGAREEARAYVSELLSDLDAPAIVVTHDWSDALALGDSMIVLREGRMLQQGTPQEVLTRPAAPEVASVVGVETVEPGVRLGRSGGTVKLGVGTSELVAVDTGAAGDDFWISIRGEDVTLETSPPGGTSARNHLKGPVTEIVPKGPLTKVTLDVGFPLVALVTRQSALDLDLEAGKEVWAVFKASIVHLIPRR